MECEEYLSSSRLFRRLRSGPHGRLVERYAARLVRDNLVGHGTWRCLNVVGGLLCGIAKHRRMLADLDERVVEQYLPHRATKQSIHRGIKGRIRCMRSFNDHVGPVHFGLIAAFLMSDRRAGTAAHRASRVCCHAGPVAHRGESRLRGPH